MAHSVEMPALGESVTEGTVTRWLKQVGEPVEVDEPLLEVSTDKVDTEIPAPVAGTVLEISVGEDETVAVGARLAVIGSGSAGGGEQPENQSAPESQPQSEPEPEPEVQRKPEPERVPQQADSDGSQPAAPTSRRWSASSPPSTT